MRKRSTPFLLFAALLVGVIASAFGIDYFEDFGVKGRPKAPKGSSWGFANQLHPDQKGWEDFCPGDGNAHLILDADEKNDKKKRGYQSITLSTVPPNHRMEIRAKNLVIPGFAGFIFTFMYPNGWKSDPVKSIFHEIDIEVVADDLQGKGGVHPIEPGKGWSDARFNSWAAANEKNFKPFSGIKDPIKGVDGKKVSHMDGDYHVYSIDWIHTGNHKGLIRFFIDGVLQHTITKPVPDIACDLILGFRDLPWAGTPKWKGRRTCLIDWVNIKPIDIKSPTAEADAFRTTGKLVVKSPGVLGNDGKGLSSKVLSTTQHGKLELRADGSFTYTPKRGFVGTDHFVYQASNGKATGTTNAAAVSIKVTGVRATAN